VKRSSHISIDILVKVLPPAPRRWLCVVSQLITLTVVTILAIKGFRLLQITGMSESPALGIRWAYVYAAFPIGMSIMAARYACGLIALLRGSAAPIGQPPTSPVAEFPR
jgi:TRAP-type C4-dicarboxylate transport system permease small subunit